MCTVSLVPLESGVRLVCNRDEARTRPSALPPRRSLVGGRPALFPLDPVSGGTWIGVNDTGLALVLLNRSAGRFPVASVAPQSRGLIIPQLLPQDRLVSAVDAALGLRADTFDPFRLVAVQGNIAAIITSNARELSAKFVRVDRPLLWTSSSLGDVLVEGPRGELFDHLVVRARDGWARGQRRFHRHRWCRHPELSVVMSRSLARTVSRTTIELGKAQYALAYEPLEPPRAAIEYCLAGAA